MAYEFKKLTELELVESAPADATVLIETEGVMKRAPGGGIGGGQGDWKQNDSTASDYIKNRPGGYERNGVVYTFDGDYEGKPYVECKDGSNGTVIRWVRVGDCVSGAQALIGGRVVLTSGGETDTWALSEALVFDMAEYKVGAYQEGEAVIAVGGSAINITKEVDVAPILNELFESENETQMATSGMYLMGGYYADTDECGAYTQSLTVPAGAEEIPEKYTAVKENRVGGYWNDQIMLNWDGNTEGLESVDIGGITWYRVYGKAIPVTGTVCAEITSTTTKADGTQTTEKKEASGKVEDMWPWGGEAGVPMLENSYSVILYKGCSIEDAYMKPGVWMTIAEETTTEDGEQVSKKTWLSRIDVSKGWVRWPEKLLPEDTLYATAQELTTGQKQQVRTNIGAMEDGVCILPSTTAGSTKKFKITVDDTGTLSATEVQ